MHFNIRFWKRTLVHCVLILGLLPIAFGQATTPPQQVKAPKQVQKTKDATVEKTKKKPQPAPETKSPKVKKESPLLKKLEFKSLAKSIQDVIKKYKLPGLGFALVTKDRILYQGGFGWADIAKKKPVKADTIFRAGSVSKSFLALGFLKLAEQGKLRLDDPITKWISKKHFTNPWEKTHPIRIVHLLEHTAGFDDMHPKELYNIQHSPQVGLKKMLTINPTSRVSRWQPGLWQSYSNPGYGLAGHVMEKVTKQSFEDFLQKDIFAALDMKVSSFRKTKAVTSKLAEGYVPGRPKAITYHYIYHRPAGSLHTSPAELAKFLQFMLKRGVTSSGKRLLSIKSIQRMEMASSPLYARKGLKQGYGLGNYVTYKEGLELFGHDGGIDGFISSARYSKKLGIGYVLLLNSMNGMAFKELNELVTKAIAKLKKNKQTQSSKEGKIQDKSFAGTYQAIHSRNQLYSFMRAFSWLRLTPKKGHWEREHFRLVAWGNRASLYPVGNGLLRVKKNPTANHLLTKHDGKEILFVQGQAFQKKAGFWPYLNGFFILFVLLLKLSALLFSLVWLPRRFLFKVPMPYLRARALPFLGIVVLLAAFFSVQGATPESMATVNAHTLGFFLLTTLYGILSLGSLVTAIRAFSVEDMNRIARIHSLLVSCANFGFMLFVWPMIGLRMWA